jgi:hypothetical protein
MGNQTSQQINLSKTQHGRGYINNTNDIQHKIESLINNKNNKFSETINFSNSSNLDLDSLRDDDQIGGFLDLPTVKPRRARYLTFKNKSQLGGQDNTQELSSIDENDFQVLKDILKKHQTSNTDLKFSPTSSQPVDFSESKKSGPLKCASRLSSLVKTDAASIWTRTGSCVKSSPSTST